VNKQREYEELDRMLDDLNANREPADLTDDLADLVEMARGLKELGHTSWPDGSFPLRTAIQLSHELDPQATPVSFTPRKDDADHDATGELPPLSLPERDLPAPTLLRRRRSSNLRKSLEIAAAAVVLVLFTALIATLLGNMNGGSPASDPTAQANSGAAFGAAPATSTSAPQTTAPAITGQSSTATAPSQPAAVPSPDASLPASISDPTLQAVQAAAGFDLQAPATAIDGLTMQPPAQPMTMGNFTSVALKYKDATGNEALTITEASSYQDSAETMPADIFNSAVPTDLGNGQTVSVYQSETNIQIWWNVGPTSIRLESGGPAGTTLLGKDVMLDIARSLVPVVHATPATPSASGTGVTKDAAIAKARTLLGSLGGHADSGTGTVEMTPLADQVALGMPQPTGVDTTAPVWSVNFPQGMAPDGCPALGNSVCNAGSVTVIVDVQTGNILAWQGPTGAWKQP
jgi:hypothetical protein